MKQTDKNYRQRRWINTRVELQWNEKTRSLDEVSKEGYWHEGAMALAHNQAALEQVHFKFWEDDASTQVAATDTNPTLNTDTTYVLQIELENNGDIDEASVTYEFQYQLNAGGWVNITAASSAVKTANPTGITNGTATVVGDNLGSGNTFQAGEEIEDGVSAALALATGGYTDFRFGFTIDSANVADTDTLDFRCTFNGYTTLDTYTVAISSTVSETANVTNQAVSGSMTPSGSLSATTVFKVLSDGSITTSGSLSKSITQLFTGIITPSATIQKQTNIDKSGSFTMSATLALKTVILQLVTGSSTLSGIESRLVELLKAGQITSSATISKEISKGLAGSIAITGNNQKRINSIADGSLTPVGTLSASFVALVSLAGSSILSGIVNTLFIPGGAVVEKFNRIINKTTNKIISKLVRKM